jgi:two-component system, NarL family, response regulator DegU
MKTCTLDMKLCNPKLSTILSQREIEILSFFAKGFNEEEIGDILFIAKNTVHNHINNMYRKIGLTGKTSPDRKLVYYAYSKKII